MVTTFGVGERAEKPAYMIFAAEESQIEDYPVPINNEQAMWSGNCQNDNYELLRKIPSQNDKQVQIQTIYNFTPW